MNKGAQQSNNNTSTSQTQANTQKTTVDPKTQQNATTLSQSTTNTTNQSQISQTQNKPLVNTTTTTNTSSNQATNQNISNQQQQQNLPAQQQQQQNANSKKVEEQKTTTQTQSNATVGTATQQNANLNQQNTTGTADQQKLQANTGALNTTTSKVDPKQQATGTTGTQQQQNQIQQQNTNTQQQQNLAKTEVKVDASKQGSQQNNATGLQNQDGIGSESYIAVQKRIPQVEPITDKDLQGKAGIDQISYLESLKVKYSTQIDTQTKQFKRQETLNAYNRQQMKKQSIMVQRSLIQEQTSKNLRLLQKYEEKKAEVDREIVIEDQRLESLKTIPAQAQPKVDPKVQGQPPSKEEPTKIQQLNQISSKLQTDIEILKARILEGERVKLELEELLEDKSDFLKQNGDLILQIEGLEQTIKRQEQELKLLDAEVEKKKQEEIMAIKSQNDKASQSLVIMSKLEGSIKTHYREQELISLEQQYKQMQEKIKTQILDQEKLNKKIGEAKTLNNITDEHIELQKIRSEIKLCQDQLINDRKIIQDSDTKINAYQNDIYALEALYEEEVDLNRELTNERFWLNEQVLEQQQNLDTVREEYEELKNQEDNKPVFIQQRRVQGVPISSQFATNNFSSQQLNTNAQSQDLYNYSPLRQYEAQDLQNQQVPQQYIRQDEVLNQVQAQDQDQKNQQLVYNEKLDVETNEKLSDQYLETHKKLLQSETNSFDLLLFFIAVITLLLLVNIYFSNYRSLEPISTYARMTKDFLFSGLGKFSKK
ncbi:UNKNOWN [Stylonychia lemnae]|uniref:Transmembrane protein n=1 Tax=Stylonychia lemnae TaxID=5949 RepID=A0A078B7K9_STYLE|nr:UNKNOWN [Stylonychia lemnae]|eukprot:CDW90490.1 UNKNOWN [Stylonychia lemnae]